MKVKSIFSKFFNLYRKMPIQMKASIWFVMSTVLLKGISFITVPIFTRIMSTEQYGIYNVYLTWCEIFTIVGTFGFESCAYVSALTKFEKKSISEVESSLLELSWLLTTLLMLLCIIFSHQITDIIGLPESLIMLMCVQIFFIPAVNFWLTKNRFQYNYKNLVFVSISMAVLNAAFGVLAVVNFGIENQALGRVISIVVIQILYGSTLLFKLLKGCKLCFSIKYWKWAIRLHLPLLPHILSLKVLAGSDKIMINAMIGATATALYSVSYSVAVVINLIKSSIVDSIRPWLYSCLRDNKTENIKDIMTGILIIVSMLTLVCLAFAPEIIMIVAPNNYYEAIYCMPPVMISSYFTFLYSIFSIVEMYYEETKKIMIASIVAAILNVFLNAVFINLFGYIAAAFTTLICYIFLACFHYIMVSIIMKKNVIEIELFDSKSILLISLFLIILMLVFVYLYSQFITRYLFLLILVCILTYRRKYFINIIKSIRERNGSD